MLRTKMTRHDYGRFLTWNFRFLDGVELSIIEYVFVCTIFLDGVELRIIEFVCTHLSIRLQREITIFCKT